MKNDTTTKIQTKEVNFEVNRVRIEVKQKTSLLLSLAKAAQSAPSGDNTQPWKISVDLTEGSLVLEEDASRDPSPMNSGGRMSRIACGAALENIVQEANSHHVELKFERNGHKVKVTLGGYDTSLKDQESHLAQMIPKRCSNRRIYSGLAIPEKIIDSLGGKNSDGAGTQLLWRTNADLLKEISGIISEADLLIFEQPDMRKAFLSCLRSDKMKSEDGLPLDTLEASKGEKIGMSVLKRMPQWLVKFSGAIKNLAAHSRDLAESASAICVISSREDSPMEDWSVGRVMQKTWLNATAHGLSLQPMMSLVVLANLLRSEEGKILKKVEREISVSLEQRIHKCLGLDQGAHPSFIFRVGYAAEPTGRTWRIRNDNLVVR